MPRLARPPGSASWPAPSSGNVPRVTETAFFSLTRRISSFTVVPGVFDAM